MGMPGVLAMIIDAHAHVGHGRYKSLSGEELLRQMDEHGIDRAIICPVEEQIAVFNRQGNDDILDQVHKYPNRFTGFAVANPWYGEIAVEELERALQEGLCGLKLQPVIQGFSMNDPIVYPLIDVAAHHRVPVYAHTGTAHFGEPFKLVELARYYPEVTFIMGHSGSSDFWSDLGRSHQFAPNILFETSRNGPAKYTNMIRNIGADYIVFGSNAPESLYPLELASIREMITDPGELEKILGLNMQRVLGLVAS
jgi:predicted TIM-barrel fold metal-dependent hydrolase